MVRSFVIYRAVLDGGVRTPDDFAAWLAQREEESSRGPAHPTREG